MDPSHQGRLISYAVGGVIFLMVLSLRMRRMMQSRPFNLRYVWVLPAVFIALTAVAIATRPPVAGDWGWIAASLVLGAALGWLRAKTIRLVIDPATRQVMAQGSPMAMLLIVALFAVRFGLRAMLQSQSGTIGLSEAGIDGAFLAMACGLFIARAIEMGLRARQLLTATPMPTI